MPQCYDFKILIDKLVDAEISPVEKRELNNHLDSCNDCRNYMEKLKKMRRMFSQLPRVKTTDDFYVLLRARIRRELSRGDKRFYNPILYPKRIFQYGFSLAVVVLLLLLINPFNIIRNESESHLSISEKKSNEFNGQIQYVIDGYPTSVSLSRDGTIDSLINSNDSLRQLGNNKVIRSHVTPVNF